MPCLSVICATSGAHVLACRRWDADVDLSEDDELWAEMREFWSDDDMDDQDARCAYDTGLPPYCVSSGAHVGAFLTLCLTTTIQKETADCTFQNADTPSGQLH